MFSSATLVHYVLNLDDFFIMTLLAVSGLAVIIILEIAIQIYFAFRPMRRLADRLKTRNNE